MMTLIPDPEAGRQAHHRPAAGAAVERQVLLSGRHVPAHALDRRHCGFKVLIMQKHDFPSLTFYLIN
jgi:hypothetical protein